MAVKRDYKETVSARMQNDLVFIGTNFTGYSNLALWG